MPLNSACLKAPSLTKSMGLAGPWLAPGWLGWPAWGLLITAAGCCWLLLAAANCWSWLLRAGWGFINYCCRSPRGTLTMSKYHQFYKETEANPNAKCAASLLAGLQLDCWLLILPFKRKAIQSWVRVANFGFIIYCGFINHCNFFLGSMALVAETLHNPFVFFWNR